VSEAPHTVELRVGGHVYGGFLRGSVRQSLDRLAITFQLSYTDRWAEGQEPWPIEEGDACAVLVDDEVLVEGYVDETDSTYTDRSWSLGVSGRSKLGDLVDCAARHRGSQWLDAGLEAILGDLVRPFGVRATVTGPKGRPLRRFKFDPGDTVADVVGKLARLRGLVPVDRGGELELVHVETVVHSDVLRRGNPVLRAQRTGSWVERFSEYHFRGQTQADDEVSGARASQIRGFVEDPQVTRYRPTVILSGGFDGERDAGRRAQLERNQRAGRAERITCTVPGFRNVTGALWRPGQAVQFEDDWLRVSAVLIVAGVEMAFGPGEVGGDADAMETTLELARPEAYGTGNYPARRRGQSWVS
jgi:prophage tail gpP-like protein